MWTSCRHACNIIAFLYKTLNNLFGLGREHSAQSVHYRHLYLKRRERFLCFMVEMASQVEKVLMGINLLYIELINFEWFNLVVNEL